MGASASVEHKMDFVVSKRTELLKLRNFMVMKAFNLRSKGGNGDLESQFSFLKERIEEEEYIDFKALFDYLKVPQHRKKVLLDVYHLLDSARNTDELKHKIEFKLFQQFMAQGIPEDWTNAIEKAALSDSTVLNEGIALESSPPVDGPPECDDQPECDNGPPECDDEGGQPECDDEGGQPECDDEGGQPECDTENATEANSTVSESVLQEKSTALVARNNAPLEFEKEGTGTMSLLNKKGMWKKREVTIQEKIIEYTKIDDDGVPQNLVEREKQQVEVMHMESADGEFAHRETTHFEQIEELNDKVVHHEVHNSKITRCCKVLGRMAKKSLCILSPSMTSFHILNRLCLIRDQLNVKVPHLLHV